MKKLIEIIPYVLLYVAIVTLCFLYLPYFLIKYFVAVLLAIVFGIILLCFVIARIE
uniref:Uncharacterized protein n=1 Tax=Siphoviridae sp. ctZHD14 TaxID=2827891 RepID=A0A8S5SWI2_9CAUD|nr:MAG TPA: hypothetical protein [Siphoviridae sp. ctZHD14]